jgi:hypothetical protein
MKHSEIGRSSSAQLTFGKNMMSRVFILFLMFALPIYADSVALISADDMIRRSDYIAIVEYLGATSGVFRGPSTDYGAKGFARFSRQSTVKVIDNVKGDLSGEIQIYDGSGRWDALFQNHQDWTKQPKGKYLVFLKGKPNFLTGVYGLVSTAQIDGTNIDWTEGQPRVRQMVPLEDILTRVRAKQKQ